MSDDRGLEGWLVVQDDGGSLLLQSPKGEWRRVDTDMAEMERLERVNRTLLAESVRVANESYELRQQNGNLVDLVHRLVYQIRNSQLPRDTTDDALRYLRKINAEASPLRSGDE